MKKIITISIIAALVVTIFPVSASANTITIPYYGTTSETEKYLWADKNTGDDQFTRVDYVSDGSNVIEWYGIEGTTATYMSSSTVSGTGSITPPGGTAALKLRSNGGEIYLTYAESTNPTSRHIYFESGGSGGGDGGDGGGNGDGGGGNCGCIFNTPGWQDYMDKVDEIIGKIPPAPDWDRVAGIFSDSIVPRLINGVDDMLGRAPSLPSVPSSPGSLDDGNLKKPTGQDSGLEGFNDSDIKDGDTIKEREDDSGGWDILDPIESMPDQETFVPDEGDLEAPEVPDVEGEAPEPEEPENPTPSDPEEPENPVPSPDDPDNHAPTPNEPDNEAPTPEESDNEAPTPSEPSNPFPTPGESENQFPIPGENNSSYPMPGSGNNQAPIPGRDNTQAPTPGKSNMNAPLPGKGGN